jgi:hypothetical protein
VAPTVDSTLACTESDPDDPAGSRATLPRTATLSILRGCRDSWGPTDVDSVVHLAPTEQVLLHGQVLEGLSPTDKPGAGKKPADYR